MTNRIKVLAGFAALSALFACGGGSTPNMVRVGNVKANPKPDNCSMRIIDKESEIGKPYEKLCIINPEPKKTVDDSRQELRLAGCMCGADAVVIADVKAQEGKAAVTGWAIRFTDASIPAPTPAPNK